MALIESSDHRLKRADFAPSFSLLGTDEKTHSLDSLKGEKATLIIFMCNHCPYVKPKIEEMKRIAANFTKQGVSVIAINPNDEKKYPDDSFENMILFAKEKMINFPYLRDETQEVAKSYGATCTPDPFLFDSDLKLIFHSRLDDTHGSDPALKHEMHNAISEYLGKVKISQKEKPSMGCSIKWK